MSPAAATGHGATPRSGHMPVVIDPETCIRCVICDYVCPGDIIYTERGSQELPEVRYPDECWYCGMCEQACPTAAITIVFPDHMLHCTTPVRSLLGKVGSPEPATGPTAGARPAAGG